MKADIDGFYDFAALEVYFSDDAGTGTTPPAARRKATMPNDDYVEDAWTTANTEPFHNFAAPMILAAGDYLTLQVWQDSGGDLDVLGISASTELTWIRVHRIA